MKVISGIYKGRNIEGYDLKNTRPTMDRVKESLFGMIQEKVENSIILDLFSGSGNLGIESLSEGGKYSYLVDSSYEAIKTINKNINNIGIKNIEVIKSDYEKALLNFKNNNINFDIIFLDPPYKTNYIEKSIKLIEEYNLLKRDGLIICESDNLEKIIYSNNFYVYKNKKYGDKFIVILKNI